MYEKFANWKNFPDESTPVTAAALTHIEQGITDVDITRDGTPAEVALSSRLSATAGSAEGLVQAERAAREAALALKADSAEMIDALGLKANASAVYTKAQVDAAVSPKANSADVYTKAQSDTALGLKANKTDVYTKAETYTRTETGTQITTAITASRPILYGTGFPNGVVAAPVGTLYSDEAVTNGASLWQKVTGTGNTGWVVAVGDTGWRDISSGLINGWALGTGGSLVITRDTSRVTLLMKNLQVAGATSNTFWSALPVGYRPRSGNLLNDVAAATGTVKLRVRFAERDIALGREFGNIGDQYSFVEVSWATKDPWPTSLPGTN